MSYLRPKLNCINDFADRRIINNKNVYYVSFENVIVIGDFKKMKYYYLDSVSSVFYKHIIETDSFSAAIERLEGTMGMTKDKFINELVIWCNDMCDRGILCVK